MAIMFEADLETGDLSEFTAVSTEHGACTVNTVMPFQGVYHGVFVTNPTNLYAQARGYWILSDMSDVYVRGYFNIIEGLPLLAEGDRFFLLSIERETDILALAGIRKINGVDRWTLMVADRMGWNWIYGNPASANKYHCVELHWKYGEAGVAQLFVDGRLEAEFTCDTSARGFANRARCGVTAKIGTESVYGVMVYGDTVAVADTYIGPVAPPPAPPLPSWVLPVAIGVTAVAAVCVVYLLKKKS